MVKTVFNENITEAFLLTATCM